MQSIRDILIESGIPFTGGAGDRAGWIQTTCPDCGSRSSKGHEKYYLGISLITGAANCWRCGRKDTARILSLLTGRSKAAMRDRVDSCGLGLMPVRKKGRLKLPTGIVELTAAHRAYLENRGLDWAGIAGLWGVRAIAQAPKLAWRLFIPIHNRGELVSWTTRSIRPKETMRYISAGADDEAVPHKTILYGADHARHSIIIHEGPIDAWATGPGAVATCGTGYTEAQLLAMSKYATRVICFDSEPEAQERAAELADSLSSFPGNTYNVTLETGDDAAEAHPDEIKELRETFLK